MNRKTILAGILGATVLAVGLGSCHMFLEDWGTFDTPCTEDRHCQKDFYCHRDICKQSRTCEDNSGCLDFNLASTCKNGNCTFAAYDPKPCTVPEDENCPTAWDCVEFDAPIAAPGFVCAYPCDNRYDCAPNAICAITREDSFCATEGLTGGYGEICEEDFHCSKGFICRTMNIYNAGSVGICTRPCDGDPTDCGGWHCCQDAQLNESYCTPQNICAD
jgi:hypothetical protein